MKNFLFLALSGLCLSSFATNFSGKYACKGYDTKDGPYGGDILTLTIDAKHSHPDRDLYSYAFSLSHDGDVEYDGSAVSVGSNLSIYFKNTDPQKTSDQGVGLAVASSIARNSKGEFVPSKIQKFYYEKDYVSDGSEECELLLP